MPTFNPDVAPAWHAVRINETGYYDEKFLGEHGVEKIWGIYVTNFNSHTFCCELTPSYELHFMGSMPEDWPEDERKRESLFDDLSENDAHSSQVLYYHCSAIKALSDDCKHPIEIEEDDWRDDPEDSGLEAAREVLQGNPIW
jgi:hypothetical protein